MHTRATSRRRIGLVLGPGGTLGAAWMIGALGAVQERIGRPLQELDIIIGTSAGSILAASLRYGLTPAGLEAHQRGDGSADLPGLHEFEHDSGILPPLPRLRLGSPGLLARAALGPHRVHPTVAASALLLQGRAQHHTLHRYIHHLVTSRGTRKHHGGRWPRRRTWVVVVDYESGRRVAFGRDGSPVAPLPDAVVASCSIPGWHAPKRIGERRYIDGGVRSVASVDLLRREQLDEVYVLAPMAYHEADGWAWPSWRAERILRQWHAAALSREVRKVTDAGTKVVVLAPGPDELAAMGLNLMDGRRRGAVLEAARRCIPVRLAALDRRS